MKKIFFSLSFLFFFSGFLFSQFEVYTGTGFFAAENGLIVTCAHVIDPGSRITAKIAGREYDAQVLFKNTDTDLAVLKINYKNSFHFRIINFAAVSLGDDVLVLGFPLSDILGTDIRLTSGIVSAKSGLYSDQTYFQMSAPIQPGNSGGPIFNKKFEVIGVAAQKLNEMAFLISSDVFPQNVNFGVKSNYINQLYGEIRYGRGNVRTMDDAINATVEIYCYGTAGSSGSSVNIINKTGFIVNYVYVSPSDSGNWGMDKLGSGVLFNNKTITVSSLQIDGNTRYDIRIIDENNNPYTKKNLRLTNNQSVEFYGNDIDNRNAFNDNVIGNQVLVRINNNTRYTIFYMYASNVSSNDWGEDLLKDNVLLSGESLTVTLPYSSGITNRYNIQLKDYDGDTYTRNNVLITPNMTVDFIFFDIDY
ncbi:MAG: serine protease [Treponema sp.]|nr:serine protease [Treponema sp.]